MVTCGRLPTIQALASMTMAALRCHCELQPRVAYPRSICVDRRRSGDSESVHEQPTELRCGRAPVVSATSAYSSSIAQAPHGPESAPTGRLHVWQSASAPSAYLRRCTGSDA